ncbi:DUF2125 domain-containing protein [Roseomonas sp. OT10]|uniref:DUF2125 domain-containing protein n=1 Tax=Roseomonas cutis TaxID=2897332 RepID=UPI001E52C295|nr:DUF2125 domain-containing protein [Roseomonas sp. OT10]UFN47330.1 DUF2125 domain-containing protein [Roseomonas sp. OT10]
MRLGWLLLPAGLGLLALLALGHTLLWRTMASRLEEGFTVWANARRAQGWRVEHGPPQRGGWPFAANLRLPDFHLEGGQASVPGGVEWQATAVVLRVVLPRLDELRVEARGPQRLRLGHVDLPFAADRLEARVPIQADVLPRGGDLLAERLRLGLPGPDGSPAPGGLEFRSLRGTIETRSTATEGEPAVTLTAEAGEVMLPAPPGGGSYALGPSIGQMGLEAVLTGPNPGGRLPAARAAAWRDGGGVLELRGVTLRWGEVEATAAATLALDEALQPMGAGTLRLTGAQAALNALVQAGLLPQRSAAMAGQVAGFLARPTAEGGPPQLEIPATLEERTLAVARIPIARLPPLAWPEPPAAEPGPEGEVSDPSLPGTRP